MHLVQYLPGIFSALSQASTSGQDGAAALFGMLFMCIFWFIMIIVWVAMMVFAVGGLVLTILMIVDAAKRDFENPNDRVMWIVIIFLTGLVGAAIYYFMVKQPADAKLKAWREKSCAKKYEIQYCK